MYLHRYDENTIAMIRTSYLHPLQEAYNQKQDSLQQMRNQENGSREQALLQRRLDKLDKQIAELTKYDVLLQHVANLHISLDLDDGVVANYPKAQAGEKLFTPLK